MKNHFTFDEIIVEILSEEKSVFEIGCGDGKLYQRLKGYHNNLKYTGTDISKNMIEYCRNKFPDATWQHYDLLPYPYPDKCFDFCIIENILHHLNDYEAICSLIKEALRIANRVVFFEPLQSDSKFLQFWKSIYWRITDGGKFYFTYSEFHDLFKNTGAKLHWEKLTEPLHQLYSCEISRFKST
jgi:ubiquinone/menaquinone biosynthesis C-methylase UbiE